MHQLGVTLEEIYNGATRKLALQRNLICDKCEGRGGKKNAAEKCMTCRGTGIQTRIQQLGPGIVQHMETVCMSCHGQREVFPEKDKCKGCHGKKTIRDRKILEVHVDKGMRDQQKIVFTGEGDQEPEIPAGDIVVVLDEKEHPIFKRVSEDLVMVMNLQLVEALCGFQKVVKTLDQRDLVITSLPGEIIKHEEVKCVMGEGMPRYKEPFEKGRLLIQFMVQFPETVNIDMIPQLEMCLPGRVPTEIPIDAEECNLMKFDPNQEERRQRSQQAYEEDMQGSGARHVQCPTS